MIQRAANPSVMKAVRKVSNLYAGGSKMSLAGLAGVLPLNLNYKGATEVGVALGKKFQQVGPAINGRRTYNVQNRELLMSEVLGATTFTLQKRIELNPGLSETFPWLSTIAQNYEEYKFKRLVFRYITRSPTTSSGSVMLCPLYDPLSGAPTTEAAASAVRGTCEGPIWEEHVFDLTRLVTEAYKRYFLRAGPVAADLKTYDLGALCVFTNDCASTAPIGKLWVEYDVDFYEPSTTVEAGGPISVPHGRSLFVFGPGATFNLPSPTSTVDWRIAEPVCNSLGATLDSSGSFHLPAGCYMVRSWVVLTDSNSETWIGIYDSKLGGVLNRYGTLQKVSMVAGGTVLLELNDCITVAGTEAFSTFVQVNSGIGSMSISRAAIEFTVCSS